MAAQTTAVRRRGSKRTAGILVPAILAELERQGRTKYWLAAQIGVAPNVIYQMLKRGFSVYYADRMLAALDMKVLPRR